MSHQRRARRFLLGWATVVVMALASLCTLCGPVESYQLDEANVHGFTPPYEKGLTLFPCVDPPSGALTAGLPSSTVIDICESQGYSFSFYADDYDYFWDHDVDGDGMDCDDWFCWYGNAVNVTTSGLPGTVTVTKVLVGYGTWTGETVTVGAAGPIAVGTYTGTVTVDDINTCSQDDDPALTFNVTIRVKPNPPTCPPDENENVGCEPPSGGCGSGCGGGGLMPLPGVRRPDLAVGSPDDVAGPAALGGDFGEDECSKGKLQVVDTCSGFYITGRLCGKCFVKGPVLKPDEASYPYTVTFSLGDGNTLSVTLGDAAGSSTCVLTGPDGSRSTYDFGPLSETGYKSEWVGPTDLEEPGGTHVEYNRDSNGALESVVMPNGDTWTYEHEPGDNKITRVIPPGGSYPSGNYTDITYAAEGPGDAQVLKSITTYGGEKPARTEYSYSDGKLGQVSKGYVDGGQFTATRSVTYTHTTRYNQQTQADDRLIIVTETSVTPNVVTEYNYGSETSDTTTVTMKHPTDPNLDRVTTYRFTLDGSYRKTFVTAITDPEGNLTQYSNHSDGRPSQITDPMGNVTTYEYDTYSSGMNVVKKITYGEIAEDSPVGSVQPTEEYAYYKDAQQQGTVWTKWHRDVRGNYTFYERDTSSLWRVDAIKVASEAEVIEELQALPSTPDDPAWTTFWSNWAPAKEYDYYADGKLQRETVPGIDGAVAQVTEYVYTENGKTRNSPTQVIYQYPYWNGSSWSYTTKTSITRYDDAERVLETEDADGRKVWYRYDGLGRQTRTIYKWLNGVVDGTPEIYTENHYSPCCAMVDWVRDENENKTYYEYDALGRTKKMWTDAQEPSGSSHPLVEYSYDCFGQQASVTTRSDASTTRVTTYTYDDNGRVKSVSYPGNLLGQELFWYDANGNVRFRQDGNGKVTAYEYDQANRLQHIHHDFVAKWTACYQAAPDLDELAAWPASYWWAFWYEGFDYVHPPDVNYAYDGGSGLRTAMADSTGMSRYYYDSQGRLIRYVPSTKNAADYVIAYSYNNLGQKTSVRIGNPTIDDPEDPGYATCALADVVYDVSYEHFANGWLRNVKSGAATIAEYEYDEVGNRTRVKLANGTYTDYALAAADSRYPTDAIRHYKMLGQSPQPGTDTPIGEIAYTGGGANESRDGMGNPRYIRDTIGAWTYGYDSNNRLDWALAPNLATTGNAARAVADQPVGGDYVYDWVGNRTSPPAGSNAMVYNAVDQLVAWPGMHGDAAHAGYVYDSAGNLTNVKDISGSADVARYAYHSSGLMNQAQYAYNPTTQTWRTLTSTWDADSNRVGMNANGTEHSFVYDTTAGIPAVIEESSGGVSVYYIREPGGELIARFDTDPNNPNPWRYYHFDELGSTRLLTDANGTVTDRYAYDAYGSLLAHDRYTGSVNQPYQYVGRLGYYTHYQEPDFGLLQLGVRFYDAEVGRFTQTDPIPNVAGVYAYAGGSPVSAVDPSGLKGYRQMSCPELASFISNQTKELKRHYAAMLSDRGYLYERENGLRVARCAAKVRGTWSGHLQEYENMQKALGTAMDLFDTKCKRGDRPGNWDEGKARLQIPAPLWNNRNRPRSCATDYCTPDVAADWIAVGGISCAWYAALEATGATCAAVGKTLKDCAERCLDNVNKIAN